MIRTFCFLSLKGLMRSFVSMNPVMSPHSMTRSTLSFCAFCASAFASLDSPWMSEAASILNFAFFPGFFLAFLGFLACHEV
jgi:hypothetical protein